MAHDREMLQQLIAESTSFDHRTKATVLRRALGEIRVEYACNACGISEWRGKHLVLEIDHIDGKYWNNCRENLQYLCPNCHSQKK